MSRASKMIQQIFVVQVFLFLITVAIASANRSLSLIYAVPRVALAALL